MLLRWKIVAGAFAIMFGGIAGHADEIFVPKAIWGGEVKRVVEDPGSPGTYYAASYGIYKSVDGGQTWTRKPYPAAPASVLAANNHMVPSAHNTNTLAVNRNGVVVAGDMYWSPLWRSADGGDTWERVGPGSDSWRDYKRTTVVSSSLFDPDIFFAAVQPMDISGGGTLSTGLYVSQDAGSTWENRSFSAAQNTSVTDILQMPAGSSAPGRVILGVIDQDLGRGGLPLPDTGKVYYSDDNGATFTQVSSTPCYRLTWDPLHNQAWMISGKTELYRSADGITWTYVARLDATLADYQTPAGIYYSSGTLYAFTGNSPGAISRSYVYRSTDSAGGFPASSWFRLSLPPEQNNEGKVFICSRINDLVVDSRDPGGDSWGVASGEGAFYYTLNGSSTSPTFSEQTGIANAPINHGVKRAGTNSIYAVTAGLYRKIFHSPDNGEAWAQIYPDQGEYGEYANSVVLDPVNPAKVYLVGNRIIKFTVNNGVDNFSGILSDFNSGTGNGLIAGSAAISNFIINPSNPDIMYVGKLGSGPMDSGTPGYHVLRSTDAGASWSWIGPDNVHGCYWIEMDPLDTNTLYLGAGDRPGYSGTSDYNSEGFYKSTDGGETWTEIAYFSEANPHSDHARKCKIFNIFTDPDAPDVVLVNYQPSGGSMYSAISRDKGVTWNTLTVDNGAPFGGGFCFIISSSVFGGTFMGEIYRSNDLGQTSLWKAAEIPSSISWIFKGSAYAASGIGLYNITGLGAAGGGTTTAAYGGSDTKVFSYPNPYNPKIQSSSFRIRLSLPRAAAEVKVRIYSLAGELVREETIGAIAAGSSVYFPWDGRNQDGALCAPGLYFVVADVDGTKVRNKIVLVY